MRPFDLSNYWRVLVAGCALMMIALIASGQTLAAVSLAAGALVGSVSLVMIRMTCGAYVRAGLAMVDGASAAGGRLYRGGLLLARMLLIIVLVGGFVRWRSFAPWAFVLGVLAAQLALVVSVVVAGHTGPMQEKNP